ncbi:hypothetical protein EIN_425130 [Entamoeba invadens IP1]|uniref:WD repeat-containing protein n=1 Tax=Entamoeba invadens IP1 TaxID=370355 RepID=A0A0A1U9F0_ENTIV|nr:hypothetical protein EIN_425130 [Entamoeba invadens IP1]ELP89791.1 hypothetical protein EIN_425130 [Entamoeba invadens IP1]|eukprot:XP_004256562.1 hypothetical protein EIN_425130 [Entamoeba invadens IP1]
MASLPPKSKSLNVGGPKGDIMSMSNSSIVPSSLLTSSQNLTSSTPKSGLVPELKKKKSSGLSKSQISLESLEALQFQTPQVGCFKDDHYQVELTMNPQQKLNPFYEDMAWSVALNSEGTLLLVGGKSGKITGYKVSNGVVHKEPQLVFEKHSGEVLSIIFLSETLACSSSSNKEIFIWQTTKNTMNNYKKITVDDNCLVLKKGKDNSVVLGLLNGVLEIWDYVALTKIRSYEIKASITAVEIGHKEKQDGYYYVGTMDGTLIVLFDYDGSLKLVTSLTSKEQAMICHIIAHPVEPLIYVTYSSNKLMVYSTDVSIGILAVATYKGFYTNGYAVHPTLHPNGKTLFIGSATHGIYVFPFIQFPISKKTEIIGFKNNLFIAEKTPVVHVVFLNANNALFIDAKGNAAVFSVEIN